MYTKHLLRSAAFISFLQLVSSQTAQRSCFTDASGNSYFYGNSPVYYAPGNQEDWGIKVGSGGTCPNGGYVITSLQTSSGTFSCDNWVGDQQYHLIDCPGAAKGSLPEGTVNFVYQGADFIGTIPFQVTHTQVTSTAPQPTQTVTSTPIFLVTGTVTTTNTNTFTSSQITVTSPSTSVTNTITVTPSQTVTSVVTKTGTFIKTVKSTVVKQTTTTVKAPCPTRSSGGSRSNRKIRGVNRRAVAAKHLGKRYANTGDGAYGDGPLTVTTTPDPFVSTVTTNTITATFFVTTSATPDASTTVANPTPTSTFYTGSAVFSTTTTLPSKTVTRTAFTATVVTTTQLSTVTYTKTVTARVTQC